MFVYAFLPVFYVLQSNLKIGILKLIIYIGIVSTGNVLYAYTAYNKFLMFCTFYTAKSNITKEDSFGSSCSPKILRSDSSFEIIDEDSLSLKMTFNSLTPLRTSVLNPLQDAIEQNKDLKELLEKCENKMSSVRKDQDLMLQKLEEEKKRCNILEEETLRLQLNITSLNQVVIPYLPG